MNQLSFGNDKFSNLNTKQREFWADASMEITKTEPNLTVDWIYSYRSPSKDSPDKNHYKTPIKKDKNQNNIKTQSKHHEVNHYTNKTHNLKHVPSSRQKATHRQLKINYLYSYAKEKEAKRIKLQTEQTIQHKQDEVKECTFSPLINKHYNNTTSKKTDTNLDRSYTIYTRTKQWKSRHDEKMNSMKRANLYFDENEYCFHPKITSDISFRKSFDNDKSIHNDEVTQKYLGRMMNGRKSSQDLNEQQPLRKYNSVAIPSSYIRKEKCIQYVNSCLKTDKINRKKSIDSVISQKVFNRVKLILHDELLNDNSNTIQ